jgi:hypothetical protein
MVYEVGALANVNGEDDKKFTYNMYRTESVDPTKDFDFGPFSLSDYYGSAIMPSLNWVTKVKTGEVVYDPADEEQDKLLKDYEAFIEENGQIEGLPSPNEIMKKEFAPIAGQLAEGISSSLAMGGGVLGGLPYAPTGALDVATGKTLFDLNKLTETQFEPLGATNAITGEGLIDSTKAVEALGSKEAVENLGGIIGKSDILSETNPSFTTRLLDDQQLKGAAVGAVGNFAVQLALGRDPVKAAKSAGAGALGKILGNAILPGFGGVIGGVLGSIVGGRVICNELMRQGFLTRKEVVLDYKFTRDHLTPTHVNGYHVWAVWMVKQMRKGKFVKFWKHVAGHRANEISYIYGERDKPDYLGKVYRKILEPTCWVIGSFCKVTDWSVLYKQKEI